MVHQVQEESRDGDVDSCVTWCLDVLATCCPAECCVFLQVPLTSMLRAVYESTGQLHVRHFSRDTHTAHAHPHDDDATAQLL